ncbi:MAG: hypothetical protein CM1200mP22_31530 [Dehalococcoidia bacterium]|nr:MAG: hypothetical protein CM1200mP22_31530 [Dehalococcoidia bacterium]
MSENGVLGPGYLIDLDTGFHSTSNSEKIYLFQLSDTGAPIV